MNFLRLLLNYFKPVPPLKLGPEPKTMKLSERLVMNALSQDWVRETSKNHGEGIEKYWEATDYPGGYVNREPYCAAGICWAFREAMRECGIKEAKTFKRPATARAYGFEEWAKAQDNSVMTKRWPGRDVHRGDILVFSFSHVGIATGPADAHGIVPTIEFNTGGAETSNEGDGVARKHRKVALIRSRLRLTI